MKTSNLFIKRNNEPSFSAAKTKIILILLSLVTFGIANGITNLGGGISISIPPVYHPVCPTKSAPVLTKADAGRLMTDWASDITNSRGDPQQNALRLTAMYYDKNATLSPMVGRTNMDGIQEISAYYARFLANMPIVTLLNSNNGGLSVRSGCGLALVSVPDSVTLSNVPGATSNIKFLSHVVLVYHPTTTKVQLIGVTGGPMSITQQPGWYMVDQYPSLLPAIVETNPAVTVVSSGTNPDVVVSTGGNPVTITNAPTGVVVKPETVPSGNVGPGTGVLTKVGGVTLPDNL